jgi:CheY-like chemotaxis protein
MAAKILIVDDDEQLRLLLRRQLEPESYQVVEAANGEVAIEVAKHENPDVVITDLIMPGKDGIMAIQELLQLMPRIRIIAISGGPTGNSAWLPIAKKAGAMTVLKKPFSKEQLLESVNTVIQNPWK